MSPGDVEVRDRGQGATKPSRPFDSYHTPVVPFERRGSRNETEGQTHANPENDVKMEARKPHTTEVTTGLRLRMGPGEKATEPNEQPSSASSKRGAQSVLHAASATHRTGIGSNGGAERGLRLQGPPSPRLITPPGVHSSLFSLSPSAAPLSVPPSISPSVSPRSATPSLSPRRVPFARRMPSTLYDGRPSLQQSTVFSYMHTSFGSQESPPRLPPFSPSTFLSRSHLDLSPHHFLDPPPPRLRLFGDL
jgi:hypothetical protein